MHTIETKFCVVYSVREQVLSIIENESSILAQRKYFNWASKVFKQNFHHLLLIWVCESHLWKHTMVRWREKSIARNNTLYQPSTEVLNHAKATMKQKRCQMSSRELIHRHDMSSLPCPKLDLSCRNMRFISCFSHSMRHFSTHPHLLTCFSTKKSNMAFLLLVGWLSSTF